MLEFGYLFARNQGLQSQPCDFTLGNMSRVLNRKTWKGNLKIAEWTPKHICCSLSSIEVLTEAKFIKQLCLV